MISSWADAALAWISNHPILAGAAIFLIAFMDSIVVLGVAVPALPLLFAVGTMIGLGHIDGPYAVICAGLGAVAGDAVSYWVGHRWGPQMREVWPFRRFPQLIERSQAMFQRHGAMTILIARFVGPVRPFAPAIAGMLRMPLRKYLPISMFAGMLWGFAFLLPGWVFGASYEALSAVADRLALVVGGLLIVLALVWAIVLYTWRWFDHHAGNLLARALVWTRRHPHLGNYAAALIDPRRPESPSLAILAVCLLGIGWAWFALLTTVLMRTEPLAVDLHVYELMIGLRNPLSDRLLAGLASIGDPSVLLPAISLATLWLAWRRRWIAAAHWLAALGFGMVLTWLLEAVISMPRPPSAHSGFGFPSMTVTMTTITFGFFAVLIARELPGRSRVWPYLIAGIVVATLGFARLYLGTHWLSDVVGGVLLGIVWLLILGIAYRRHVDVRSFWMRPLAAIFYVSFALAALWHAPRAVDPMLASFVEPAPTRTLGTEAWWVRDWGQLPSHRNERDADLRWPLDVQVAGPLEPLQAELERLGWQAQPQATWASTLSLLDDDTSSDEQVVLPSTLGSQAETLLLRRTLTNDRSLVLRLWPAPALLDDGTPLWVGTAQTLHFERRFRLVNLWVPQTGTHHAWLALQSATDGLQTRAGIHPQSGTPVLLIRTDSPDAGSGDVLE